MVINTIIVSHNIRVFGDKIIITCPNHGEFEQIVYSHMSGFGCSECRNDLLSKKYRKSLDQFISDATKVHGNKFDYSNVEYLNSRTKIKIRCEKHGEFEQLPQSHLSGRGCPTCKESKGENKIREFLLVCRIQFEPQKKFTDCRDIRPLPFDFYLPDYNCCIEFDW